VLPIIREHEEELADLCRAHQVRRLSLFGSAVTGNFREGSSDLDFLVTFKPQTPHESLWGFMALAEDLEWLFGTHVDLLEERPFRNPYFREDVTHNRVVVYESANEEVPV
jgi:uncharacterized protein